MQIFVRIGFGCRKVCLEVESYEKSDFLIFKINNEVYDREGLSNYRPILYKGKILSPFKSISFY
jgi:hypothetical protein